MDFFVAISSSREYFKDNLCKDIRGVLNSVLEETVCHSSKNQDGNCAHVMQNSSTCMRVKYCTLTQNKM